MRKTAFILASFFLLASPVLAVEKMQIAVLDLQPKGTSAIVAGAISDIVRSEMVKTGYFTVVERGQMDAILKEQGFQLTGCTDQACAVQLGKVLSAKKILIGEINRVGAPYLITVRIVDVEKATAEFAADERAESEDVLDKAGVSLTRKLVASIYEENKDYFTPPITRSSYYMRSIVPGWGQFYADRDTKGYLFLGGFLLAAGFSAYSYMDYSKAADDYKSVKRGSAQSEFDSKYDAKVKAANMFTIAAGITAGLYLFHWMDVLFFSKPDFVKNTAMNDKWEGYFRFDTAYLPGNLRERIVYGSLVANF